jgi:hypothetical protein
MQIRYLTSFPAFHEQEVPVRFFTILAVSLFCLTSVHPVVAAPIKSHSGLITMTFDLSDKSSTAETELWLPYPVSDREQTITEVKITGDYAASAV